MRQAVLRTKKQALNGKMKKFQEAKNPKKPQSAKYPKYKDQKPKLKKVQPKTNYDPVKNQGIQQRTRNIPQGLMMRQWKTREQAQVNKTGRTDKDKELESTQTNRVMIDKQDRRTQKMVGNHIKGGNEKQPMMHEGKTETQTKTRQKMK